MGKKEIEDVICWHVVVEIEFMSERERERNDK